MSCGLTCRLNSGVNFLRSVQRNLNGSIGKNRKSISCQNFRAISTVSGNVMLMQMQSIVAKDNNILMCCPLRWSSLKTMKCSGVTCMRSQFFNTRPPTGNDQVPQEKKLSMFQKIKKMWKEYWYVVFPVHLVTSAVWAGGFYYLVQRYVGINHDNDFSVNYLLKQWCNLNKWLHCHCYLQQFGSEFMGLQQNYFSTII